MKLGQAQIDEAATALCTLADRIDTKKCGKPAERVRVQVTTTVTGLHGPQPRA